MGRRRIDRALPRAAARYALDARPRARDRARGAGRRPGRAARRPRRASHAPRRAARRARRGLDGEDAELVYSVSARPPAGRRRRAPRAARLDVGEVLADDLYPRVHSVVFTSATIAAGDDFAHFARAVGSIGSTPDRGGRSAGVQLRLRAPDGGVRPDADLASRRQRGYLGELERLLEDVHLRWAAVC